MKSLLANLTVFHKFNFEQWQSYTQYIKKNLVTDF